MTVQVRCPVCGKIFTAVRRTHIYCSTACRRLAYRRGVNRHGEAKRGRPVIRTFCCAKCGRLVKVTDLRDKRTKFCSVRCERKYWKRPAKRRPDEEKRVFTCRQCGIRVEAGPGDRRTVFCSAECRRQWFFQHRT